MRALQLKGSDLTGYQGDWMMYGANVRHRIKQGNKEYFAIESVAHDAGVSYATVRRGWKLFDATFPGDAPDPLDAVSSELS